MDIKLVGIQEPKGFDDDFTRGFPITERENNEIEVPYYDSDHCNEEYDTSSESHYETESDYASSDESAVSKRVVVKFHRTIPNYKSLLCVETDFLPE